MILILKSINLFAVKLTISLRFIGAGADDDEEDATDEVWNTSEFFTQLTRLSLNEVDTESVSATEIAENPYKNIKNIFSNIPEGTNHHITLLILHSASLPLNLIFSAKHDSSNNFSISLSVMCRRQSSSIFFSENIMKLI